MVCGLGIGFPVAAFVVGFIPPASLPDYSTVVHVTILGGAVAVGVLVPLVISWLRRGVLDQIRREQTQQA